MTPPSGGGASRSNSSVLRTRSSPGIGNAAGFFARTRDLFLTILDGGSTTLKILEVNCD